MSSAPAPDTPMLLHAVERSPDGVVIVDEAGTIVYANRTMVEMTGFPELVGMSVDELVPDSLRDRHSLLRRSYNDHPSQRPMGAGLELCMRTAQGHEVPVEISLSPFEHDGRYVVTAVRDVSERLEAQRRLSAVQEQLALMSERERIGRDLHDVVLQHLYGIGLRLQTIAAAAPPHVTSRVDEVVDDVDRVISEVRSIVFTLSSAPDSDSLGQQLTDVVSQARRVLGFSPTLRLDGPVETVLGADATNDLIASMREALSNVSRHAEASAANVLVAVADGSVVMTVTDNGIGLPGDSSQLRAGHGLNNLRQRAEARGGSCELDSGPDGQGTSLRWSVPFE